MTLTLGLSNPDKIGVCELGGLRNDRGGNFDLIMKCERPYNSRGRFFDRRKTSPEFGESFGFNLSDKTCKHIIKNGDLRRIEIVRVPDEEIGHASKYFGPSFSGADGQYMFQFIYDGRNLGHWL